MKINQIKINNYHGIEYLCYNPKEKLTFILGDNGSGKSSFISSIGYIITGNDKNPTKDGKSASQVSLSLASDIEISRAKKDNKTLLGVDKAVVNEKHFASIIQNETGQLPENLNLVTTSDIANNIDPVNFGNMLLKFIPQDITVKDIISYCDKMTPQKQAVLEEEFSREEKITIPVLRKVCDRFVEKRKELKRECATLEKQCLMHKKEPCDMSPADIEKGIKSCIEKQALLKKYAEDKKNYGAAIKTKRETEEKLAAINEFLSSVEKLTYNEEEHEALKKEIISIEEMLKDSEFTIVRFEEDIASLENIIDNLNSNVCPIHKDIKCNTDKSSVKESLEKVLSNQKENLVNAKKGVDKIKQDLEFKKQKNNHADGKKVTYEKKKNYLENKAFCEKLLKELVIPNKPEEIDEEALKKEIVFIETKKKESESHGLYVTTKAKIETTKLEIAIYDELAKSLSDKGEVFAKIMNKYVEIIQEACERTCNKLKAAGKDYEVKFVADKGIQCFVKIRDHNFLPINTLSTGEKIISSIIISDMLNQLTGLDIMVIDNFESLDEKSIGVIKNILSDTEISEMYDHIFISTVSKEIPEKFKDIDCECLQL